MTQVLDKGFIRLVESMGNDSSIVQAARVSYGKGTKTVSDDEKLIRYLMRHEHTTPFEMVEFKFHVKAPIFIARQWFRHRTGSFNEVSARYSEVKDEYYVPEHFRKQHKYNKQMSGEGFDSAENAYMIHEYEQFHAEAFALYERMLAHGVSREQARMVLPVSTYTEFYWKVNLHNLLRFIKLRIKENAQYEIQLYAQELLAIVAQITPIAAQAFHDYVLHKESA